MAGVVWTLWKMRHDHLAARQHQNEDPDDADTEGDENPAAAPTGPNQGVWGRPRQTGRGHYQGNQQVINLGVLIYDRLGNSMGLAMQPPAEIFEAVLTCSVVSRSSF